jgi:2-phosphosulfolactate phosphatase
MAVKQRTKIEVYFTSTLFEEMQLKDKNIIVIDVLRASTSVITALQHGAKEIIPVSNIDSAVKISGSLFGDVTLRAGERNGKMIDGFNLGNSPLEYTEAVVKGKSIILMTTNGSAAMVKGRHAKNLIVAAFVNLSTVTTFLRNLREDFIIICAGKENNFCVEDAVCAGKIINDLENETGNQFELNDSAVAAKALDKAFGKSILKVLKCSNHGKYLTEIGFGEDLKVCAGIDTIPLLPVLVGNVIRLQKESLKRSA